jgi:predicted MFS family arabinose efflux permease
MSPQLASTALALIGLFNIVGTYAAGSLGQVIAKNKILSGIYLARGIIIAIFISLPITPLSVYIFAAAMGLLWLSTVPVTNAVIAQIFGVSHLSMLSGFVFLSHQVGSFLGVWLGGMIYDQTGSYDQVWFITIGLSAFATLINLPVREAAIARAPQAV